MTSAVDRIDEVCQGILFQRDRFRERAAESRAAADEYDAQADDLNLELADWNAVRAHMLATREPTGYEAPIVPTEKAATS